MPAFTNSIAFVVPTKDRPHDLRRMLTSVQDQSVHPDQIVIVDGSTNPVADVASEFPDIKIEYVRCYPPSLSKQRNAGMAAVTPGVTLAGYLDDDLVFEPCALKAMLAFWEKAPADVGGARFTIVNDDLPRMMWLKSLFLMEGKMRGEVLRSGYATAIGRATEDRYVRWLSGGVTLWRITVIQEFNYDEWFNGTGYLEDVDYSYRVSRKYKLVVVANAQVQHLSYPVRMDKNYLLGKWQAVNRMYFVKKHGDFSVPLCYWSILGEIFLNIVTGIWRWDVGRLRRGMGNCAGLYMVARGRIQRIGGVFK